MTARGADVRVLPPLIFAVALVAGWGLSLLLPWPLGADTPRRWAGAVLVVLAIVTMAWAALTLTRARTTVIPWSEVSALVTSGPYRLSRNPIYVADVLAYLGAALLLGSTWPLLGLPVALVVLQERVIDREEAYLDRAFGAEYAAYRSRVRRLL